MARKKQSYIKGTFTHRRTEADYMGVLLDAVPLEAWREVVSATVAAAKAGDATARAWLRNTWWANRARRASPADGRMAKQHIDRAEYSSLHGGDDFKDALKARVADELRALEVQKPNTPENGANADGTRFSADSSAS